jgi:hypothetical protein
MMLQLQLETAGGCRGLAIGRQGPGLSRAPAGRRSDTRALLASPAGADAAAAFAASSPHPRLWRLLAEHALEARDWGLAEKSFVHCQDLAVGAGGALENVGEAWGGMQGQTRLRARQQDYGAAHAPSPPARRQGVHMAQALAAQPDPLKQTAEASGVAAAGPGGTHKLPPSPPWAAPTGRCCPLPPLRLTFAPPSLL